MALEAEAALFGCYPVSIGAMVTAAQGGCGAAAERFGGVRGGRTTRRSFDSG
jgi:hypothetical protein